MARKPPATGRPEDGRRPPRCQAKPWAQIASAVQDPSSPIAKDVNGTANYLTAAICRVTGNRPSSVCSAPFIKNLQGKL